MGRPAAALAMLAALCWGGVDTRGEGAGADRCAGPACGSTAARGTEPEEALGCMVMASPGEDAEGRHPVWWLERGVPGHWSSGLSVAVFEGDTVNVVVMASNCPAALERLGARALFDLGGRVTFSFDLPWVSSGEAVLDVSLLPCVAC